MNSLFFNARRYDLRQVGRYKVNRRLELDDAAGRRASCAPDDIDRDHPRA